MIVKTTNIHITIVSALIMLAASSLCGFAADMNVRGIVVQQGTNTPIQGVVIFNAENDKVLGTTNSFGEYDVTIDENGRLLFAVLGSKDLEEPVKGRLKIDAALFPDAQSLREVVVTGKNQNNGLVLPPADLILEGNEISLKTMAKIPHQFFSSNVRMIIQPAIYNITTRTLNYLTPVVYDGRRYDITQRRMLDWDADKDPLNKYRQVKRSSRNTDDTVYIVDKLHVDNPKNDFLCVVMSSMENYNGIIYTDTTQIARGTINPLRFLSYSLNGLPLTDENFIPKPEVQLRDTSGEVKLVFNVGKSNLDLSLGDNAAEMEKMLQEFRAIQNDPDMMLKSFDISGTASPEGSYAGNQRLAHNRMQSALNRILASIPESMRNNAQIQSKTSVATWSQVEDLLRADGYIDEADAVRNIIDKNPRSIDRQSQRMRSLPFYKSLIAEKYLPRLRKVEYHIVSSRYRPLNNEEIAALYESDYTTLSKYHFWKHYTEMPDTAKREEIMRRALEVHPDFIAVASDLTALTIDKGCADEELLKPFFADWSKIKKMPGEARHNLAVASMANNHFSYADSLLYEMPDVPQYHKAKIYCSALNGRYASVLQEIAEESPFNEVLMLLALKDNSRAFEKSTALGESAEEEYVKAIAANRMANSDISNAYLFVEASTHLANAINQKPELIEIARIDGDVCDLLDEDGNLPDDNYNEGTTEE